MQVTADERILDGAIIGLLEFGLDRQTAVAGARPSHVSFFSLISARCSSPEETDLELERERVAW